MPKWQATIEQRLSDYERYYIDNESIQQQMPIEELIDRFDDALGGSAEDPLSKLNLGAWRNQFNSVAAPHDTSELEPVIEAISASNHLPSGRPVITIGVVSLLSTIVDCRVHFASAPIQDAVSPLVTTIEAADDTDSAHERLVEATEQVAGVVRSTGLAAKSMDKLEALEFPHPEISTERVRSTIRSSLERNDEEQLRALGQEINRSADCKWTQSDLTGFADEAQTGRPFEYLLEVLWGELGYSETTVTEGAGGDGGVDVIASDENEIVGIEAKRYKDSEKIRAEDVRKLAGTLPKYDFDEVFLVTSSTVDQTDQAADEASQYENLTVIDGEALATELSKTSMNPPVFVDSIE